MSYLAIVIIILLGIFLLLLEFLVIPGITVFGIGGFVFILTGHRIGLLFSWRNSRQLSPCLVHCMASLITIYFIFKQKTWKKMGLQANINSKNEPFETEQIHPGDHGKTITRLAPMGKAHGK